MIDVVVAFEKLSGLGSADEVAGFLADQGVCGYRGSAVNCPLARWLERETGLHIAVTEKIIQARDPFDEGDREADGVDEDGEPRWLYWPDRWTFETTEALARFVEHFDDEGGAFGQLEDPADGDRHRCQHGMGW